MLGRLSMYGADATRLHQEVLTARLAGLNRKSVKGALKPCARDAEARTLEILEQALKPGKAKDISDAVAKRLRTSIGADVEELLSYLHERDEAARKTAEAAFDQRGQTEARIELSP